MKDEEIIGLFFDRSERALRETKRKYGAYIRTIVHHILGNHRDTEEVENDVYMAVWNTVPPKRPERLKHYVSRIARNLALKKYAYNTAEKRRSNAGLVLEELAEVLPAESSIEKELEAKELGALINAYVDTLTEKDRAIFVYRYFYVESVKDIARKTTCPERQVKYRLSVMRKALKEILAKEGYAG